MGEHESTSRPLLSNRAYDWLKFIAQVVLPALALFYITVAPFWGLPKQEEVAGTIVALDLFLGTLLGISTSRYKVSDARFDGVMLVGDEKDSLLLNDDVESLETKRELTFKVKKNVPLENPEGEEV